MMFYNIFQEDSSLKTNYTNYFFHDNKLVYLRAKSFKI